MSKQLGLGAAVVDATRYHNSLERFREAGIVLPTFAQLAAPWTIPAAIQARLADVEPDAADPLNLFRVHWYNAADRRSLAAVPDHVLLPPALTGVAAPIVVVLGEHFPMITAHKVLAAYGCLAPRLVTGQFDPQRHRAIWPSTGNYCRGGLAISKIMQCRGVAVLPEGMSQERFDWLEAWALNPAEDILRTPGTESNVKEIYDACGRLEQDPENVIFNQFCEYGNHLVHYGITGPALEHVFKEIQRAQPGLRLAAYVSATGSAGTLAAGDWLKEAQGTRIVAVEAQECPTLLANGFGEHNIQGIGDKHVPLIHNVMNTDFVVGVSDASTDALGLLFNSAVGQAFLQERKGLSAALVARLPSLGFSGIANVLAAIKVARQQDLGPEDVIVTVATDGYAMYASENGKILRTRFGGRFDALDAAETYGTHLAGVGSDHTQELDHAARTRMFNLGYFTWVEQQGVSLQDFEARRQQRFWRALRGYLPTWDALIARFNAETGLVP